MAENPSPLERDTQFLDSWREGDWDAGLDLMRLYYRYFLSLCHGSGVNSDEERTDLFHDVVMRIHKVLPTLSIDRSFAAYLRRVFLTAVRVRNTRRAEPIPADVADGARSPAQSLEGKEILAAILDCAETLGDREKTLFHARHFENHRLADIADEQGLTLDHLYVLYHRVRKKMMACLDRKGVRL